LKGDPERVERHRSYDSRNPETHNDIAIIELGPGRDNWIPCNNSNMRPIMLADKGEDVVNQNCSVWVVGKGRTRDAYQTVKNHSTRIQEVNTRLRRVSDRKCKYKTRLNSTTQLCAWTQNEDACKGDGGGPIMINIDENDPRYVQVGFVSYGKECPNINRGGVYTRVSGFQNWIKSRVSDAKFGRANECDTNEYHEGTGQRVMEELVEELPQRDNHAVLAFL